MTNKNIPIFFAVDNNYAPFLSVVIESIIENSSKDYKYQLFVLNNDISIEYKDKLNKYNKDNIEINFCSITEKLKSLNDKLPVRDYYSNAIFYRLFIAELYPEFDKALYLDADIVVLDDISKLYNHNVEDYYLGVCKDDVASMCSEFKEYTKLCVNVDSEHYFNSGILVMNLKNFRKYQILEKFLDLLQKVKYYVAPDQDYLNYLCKDNVLYIDQEWNKAPIKDANMENAKLIHFKLTAKPWHYTNINRGDEFWKYAKRTEFYNYLLNILNNYSEEEKEKDLHIEENLIKLALSEIERLTK